MENKNFRPFSEGKSLCEIAAAVAVESRIFEAVVISSDSTEAASIAQRSGCHFALRNAEASSDSATATEVVQSLYSYLTQLGITSGDYLYYLQPTSPSRTSKLLVESWKILASKSSSGIVTVYRSKSSPFKHLSISDDGLLAPLFGDEFATSNTQSLPQTYLASGDIFAFRWGLFLESNLFPLTNCLPMVVEKSFDIDTYDDFMRASVSR